MCQTFPRRSQALSILHPSGLPWPRNRSPSHTLVWLQAFRGEGRRNREGERGETILGNWAQPFLTLSTASTHTWGPTYPGGDTTVSKEGGRGKHHAWQRYGLHGDWTTTQALPRSSRGTLDKLLRRPRHWLLYLCHENKEPHLPWATCGRGARPRAKHPILHHTVVTP